MLSSEKRSLIRFLLIYLGSTFLLFTFATWIFYTSAKRHLLDQQRDVLKYEATKLKSQLRQLHQSDAQKLIYPKNDSINSAIYAKDDSYIFGTYLHPPKLNLPCPKDMICLSEKVEPYYLGAAHLRLSKEIDYAPIETLEKNILLFMLLGGLFFSILGYFLGKLFIAPMRDSIKQMNRFIQDTTHELNTPISTILTNIEMIDTLGKCQQNTQELKRISIASQTLSRIYDDLTYINLNHQYHRHIVSIDMGKLVKERMDYFGAMADTKKLVIYTNISKGVILQMDKNDALRLIDNLLSNAIKYNKPEGRLKVVLQSDRFVVADSGVGIAQKDLREITRRFNRANSSEGGFGIGLDIVNQVVKSYGYQLQIKSNTQKGTEVTVLWQK